MSYVNKNIYLLFSVERCSKLPSIRNGKIDLVQNCINGTAKVQCNPGYRIEGPSTITCLETGQWSNPAVCLGEFNPQNQVKSDYIHMLVS